MNRKCGGTLIFGQPEKGGISGQNKSTWPRTPSIADTVSVSVCSVISASMSAPRCGLPKIKTQALCKGRSRSSKDLKCHRGTKEIRTAEGVVLRRKLRHHSRASSIPAVQKRDTGIRAEPPSPLTFGNTLKFHVRAQSKLWCMNVT